MGTNFYIRGFKHSYEPGEHIGKRSAAGHYCWDCKQTLCVSGEAGIHSDHSNWFDECPKCGKKPVEEPLGRSAAGKELGFNKKPFKRKGIGSVCSFSWAVSEKDFKKRLKEVSHVCQGCQRKYDDPENVIEDEYGETFTYQEFQKMLKDCPVRYTHSIGQHFS